MAASLVDRQAANHPGAPTLTPTFYITNAANPNPNPNRWPFARRLAWEPSEWGGLTQLHFMGASLPAGAEVRRSGCRTNPNPNPTLTLTLTPP